MRRKFIEGRFELDKNVSDFIVEERSEPPKIYVDDLEKTRTIEFITYTTKIVESKG